MQSFSLRSQKSATTPTGATQTVITEYADVVSEAELTTERMDTAAKLTFTCLEERSIALPEGSMVEMSVDGIKMFKGYVFTAERNRDGEVSYTAYDQLRYLKANASYTFENMTLGQIIQQIATDFSLTCGTIEDTGYIFPCLIKENESCLDIIFDALSETIVQTGKIWIFYDNAGQLTLTEAKNMYTQTLFGDSSLVTDYTYKRDIDSDTYNRIKLVRPNKETGRTDVYQHEDTATIAEWGLLQYYDEVDENMNDAQIDELCKNYLTYYNRVLQSMSIDTIGVAGIRAGMIVPVKIAAIDDLSTQRLLIAEKVTHTIEADDHTMSITVKNFEQFAGGLQLA